MLQAADLLPEVKAKEEIATRQQLGFGFRCSHVTEISVEVSQSPAVPEKV